VVVDQIVEEWMEPVVMVVSISARKRIANMDEWKCIMMVCKLSVELRGGSHIAQMSS